MLDSGQVLVEEVEPLVPASGSAEDEVRSSSEVSQPRPPVPLSLSERRDSQPGPDRNAAAEESKQSPAHCVEHPAQPGGGQQAIDRSISDFFASL